MMKKCPFCATDIRDEAIKCRYCGEFLEGSRRSAGRAMAGTPWTYWGYEYRSELELFGWPLVHIARGINPDTGRPHVAKGIIAVGNVAVGLLAVGGLALGGFAIGGLSLGLFAFGGVAIGGVALGGLAVAILFAMGGLAISGMYALGGAALAPHAIGATGADPELLHELERWWPGISESFSSSGG